MVAPGLLALELTAAVVLVSAWLSLVHRRLEAIINLYLVQSAAVGLIAILVAYLYSAPDLYLTGLLVLGLNAIIFPWILHRIQREIRVPNEIRMFVSVRLSALAGLGCLLLAVAVVGPLTPLAEIPAAGLLPISVAVVLMGLFMVSTRRKAFTQVVGMLVMENGVFLAGVALTYGLGIFLELGVAANLLILAIVSRIFLYRMNDTFDTVDADVLRSLEG
jgi:hydrogenase-4 component E